MTRHSPDQTFAIVGASLAGAKAAETLRAEGFGGRLVMIGTETERPYERPPLSKEYLRGDVGRERVYVHDEAFYVDNAIELLLGRTAANMDPSINEVTLDDGKRVRYDRLLLATGAEPRRLSVPGEALGGVLYLRSVADSDALRQRLDRGGSVVVIGAGWIGAEVAASAHQRGLDVTVIDPVGVPLERALGAEVGAIYRDIHTDHGVRMLMGTGVAALEGSKRVEHWANALHQGPVAARNMLGQREPYDRVPYFFSDQYDVGMEYAGFAPTWDRVVFRGDAASREFIAFWLVQDRIVAGMNVGVWDVTDEIQRLIRERVAVDDRRLADPDVPLG